MSDAPGQSSRTPPPPHISRRRIPLVWAVPVLALGFAVWLAYNNWPRGTTISICFNSAAGLEPGKSRIVHRDIQVGLVQSVTLASDLSHVVVTARMQPEIGPYLDPARNPFFRVVRPQFSLQGFSGLDTLVTGTAIEMDVDRATDAATAGESGIEKDPACTFDQRKPTLQIASSTKSKAVVLHGNTLGSAKPGSPVLFRGVKVGEVTSYDEGDTGIKDQVTIHILVSALYDDLITKDSRFYRASAISIQLTPGGLKPQYESIDALLSGGVVLDDPETPTKTAAGTAETDVNPDDTTLYDDAEAAANARYAAAAHSLTKLVSYFTGPVNGLGAGSPVMFRGVRIGTVTGVYLEPDPLRQKVLFELEPDRLAIVTGAPPGREWGGAVNRQIISNIVKPGLQAQLKSTNLVFGQTVVAVDLPAVPPPNAKLAQEGEYLQIPVSESSDVTKLLDDADKLLAAAKEFFGGQDAKDTLQNVARLTAMLPRLLTRSEAVLTSFDKTLGSANDLIGGDSRMRRDLWDLMSQTRDMLRSVKGLTDYLEAHPEALVRGKGTDHQQ
jgi:paraquat-inducible protein B